MTVITDIALSKVNEPEKDFTFSKIKYAIEYANKYVNCSRTTLYNWIANGLPHKPSLDGKRFYTKFAVKKYIADNYGVAQTKSESKQPDDSSVTRKEFNDFAQKLFDQIEQLTKANALLTMQIKVNSEEIELYVAKTYRLDSRVSDLESYG